KGLQNGVNSSPIRQNGIGVDKKLPILQPLTLEQLLGEKNNVNNNNSVVNDERANMSVSTDRLNINNISKPSNVSSNQLKFNLKEAIAKRKFEIENKTRPMLSQGESTTEEVYSPQLKKVVTKKEQQQHITDEMNDASLSLLERPLPYLADPTAILGDLGVESVLGFETGNTDELARKLKANELDPKLSTFEKLKAKTEIGLGMVPMATVNTGLGMFGAGGIGSGLKGGINYGARVVNNAVNPLAGLGKPTVNAISNALGKNVDDVSVDATQKAMNDYYGTVNKKYNTTNVSPGSTNLSPEDVGMINGSILPDRSTNFFGKPNNDKALGEQLKPLIDELSSYASTNEAIRKQTIKNMSSPQGQQRLIGNILEEMDAGSFKYLGHEINRKNIGTRNFLTENLGFEGTTEIAKMTAAEKRAYATKIAKEKVTEMSSSPSLNENLLSTYNADGSYNPSAAMNALYKGKTGSGNAIGMSSFDNASHSFGDLTGQFKKPVWGLGTNTNNPMTAAHEYVGHGSQEFAGLGFNNKSLSQTNQGLDQRLLRLNQVAPVEGSGAQINQNYFNTGSASEFGEYTAAGRNRIRESEPRGFAAEFRQGMKEYDFLKNPNGEWDQVTPQKLKDFKKYLDVNPSGIMKGDKFSPNIRIQDIVDFDNPKNLKEFSKELNKMIGQNNPGDVDGKNKFDMLKANSMQANA
uniref:hypothetical protein n=1 Tax=Winogradskyella sp. UBA3174 TaxID=1947785 RepID=UPI0025E7F0C9